MAISTKNAETIQAPPSSSSTSSTSSPTTSQHIHEKSWRAVLPMTTNRAAASGLFVNRHQFLAIGGQSGPREYLSCVEYYDLYTNMWTHLDVHLPTNRAWCGTARINNKVFCVGGKQASANNTTLSDLVMLDLSECNDLSTLDTTTTDEVIEWKSMTPMQEGRHRFACVAHKESIYVFGGKNDKGAKVATCERYDAADNAWKRLPNLPCGPNNGCAAGVVGDKIYVVGGMGNDGTILASTMIFDTTTQTWNDNNSQKVPDMKLTRWGLSVVVVDQYLVAMGGDFEKTIEVLDTKSNSWNFAPLPMNHNDKSLPMADVVGEDEGEILVAGGLVGIRATSMAERISFRKGLFPENVRFEEWRARAIGNNSNRRDAKIVKSLAASYKGYTKRRKGEKAGCCTKPKRNGACACRSSSR